MTQIGEAVAVPSEADEVEPEEIEHLVDKPPKRMINFSC